jgi:hypothetical protein
MAKTLKDTIDIMTPSLIEFSELIVKYSKEGFEASQNPQHAAWQGAQYCVTLERWEGEVDPPVQDETEEQEELKAPTEPKPRGRKTNGQEK